MRIIILALFLILFSLSAILLSDYIKLDEPQQSNWSSWELKDLKDEVICDKAVIGDEDVEDFVEEAISRNLHTCLYNPDSLPFVAYPKKKLVISEKKKCPRIDDVATSTGYSVSFQGSNSYLISNKLDDTRNFYVLSLFNNEPKSCMYSMTAFLGETEKDISKFLNDINSASSYGNISKNDSNRIVFKNTVFIPHSTKDALAVNIQWFAAEVRLTFKKLEEYLENINA